eukprot:2822333-Amphidinium_carterae.1
MAFTQHNVWYSWSNSRKAVSQLNHLDVLTFVPFAVIVDVAGKFAIHSAIASSEFSGTTLIGFSPVGILSKRMRSQKRKNVGSFGSMTFCITVA